MNRKLETVWCLYQQNKSVSQKHFQIIESNKFSSFFSFFLISLAFICFFTYYYTYLSLLLSSLLIFHCWLFIIHKKKNLRTFICLFVKLCVIVCLFQFRFPCKLEWDREREQKSKQILLFGCHCVYCPFWMNKTESDIKYKSVLHPKCITSKKKKTFNFNLSVLRRFNEFTLKQWLWKFSLCDFTHSKWFDTINEAAVVERKRLLFLFCLWNWTLFSLIFETSLVPFGRKIW